MSKDNLTFKQNGNEIIMSDEQVYTKDSLPGLFNSLRTHLDTLGQQIAQNEQQKANCERNLKGLTSDRDVLKGRIETLEKFAAKAHIQIKSILKDPKANPQAAANDNMKVMLKKLIKEINEEEEKEMLEQLAAIPKEVDVETFGKFTEAYDKVKYIINALKQGTFEKAHVVIESLNPEKYVQKEINDAFDILLKENYYDNSEDGNGFILLEK